MYDVTGHSEYTEEAGGDRAGGGAPFTTMRAEEIFRQFFGGDLGGLGSMFGEDFGMGNQQVLDSVSESVNGGLSLSLSLFLSLSPSLSLSFPLCSWC